MDVTPCARSYGTYRLLSRTESRTDEGTKVPVLRISRPVSNLAHNNEHYGNIVTYTRIKSIVPPSSEPR